MKYNFLLSKFLRFSLVFVLIAGWLFSGWPRIWQNPRIPPGVQITKAATERQSPDAIITQTNLSGTITAIQDDPDTPDANWWTAPNNNADTVAHVSFPTPSGNPTVGADLQQFKIWVRKSPGQTGTPNVRIDLYENNVLLANIMAATNVTSDTGQLFSATWNVNLLSNADGSGVEIYIYGTKSGGPPGARATVEVGAVEWNVDYTPGLSTAIEIRAQDYTALVSTITFPEGAPEATVSQPYNNVDGSGSPQTFGGAGTAKPVVTLYNGGASTLTIWYNITTFSNSIVASESYLVNTKGAACADADCITGVVTFDANTTTGTTIAVGAGNEKDFYLKVTLSAVAGKTGTSTLTILGETP